MCVATSWPRCGPVCVGPRLRAAVLDTEAQEAHGRQLLRAESNPHVNKHVTEPKVLCLTCSEAKQTGTSELGAEKDLLQGRARRQVACSLCTPPPQKPSKLLEGFQQTFFLSFFKLEYRRFTVLCKFCCIA